jgi:imidazolonepropionase
MTTLVIHNLAEVATPHGHSSRIGPKQGQIERLPGAEVVCRDGLIAFVGPPERREKTLGPLPDAAHLDGRGGTLVPGFVDPHTHLPWAGTRENEFSMRLQGKSYQEIAAAGGGILSTVRSTRAAHEDELAAATVRRMNHLLAWGTTTAEAKSGYGLSLEDELKQLRAIRRAGAGHPVELLPTLLAAHEVPPEYRKKRHDYVELICNEIVPLAARDKLARFCDVFCESGVFSAAESRQVLTAGKEHGLLPRLHADEFADSGGAELAAELEALSADHLMAVSPSGIEALALAGVTAVLLPGTSFFLMKTHYAPARKLVSAGVPVALGTDCNPGSSHTESMPMVIVLAVLQMKMTIEEALVAATLNAACSLGLGEELGSIEVGKRGDLVLLDVPNVLHLVYHYGINPVAAVVKGGEVVHRVPGF